ncbi:malto-oligosyltrehalose synthase [Salinarimonas soli]|uniref:4-alpha-glucanotransferase n=1 Tax=Salinarimonas soli TaxID=1638099 RepID=A0A5B2VH34_9HYPH|nr:malto-oligosyltrehalose synthase [Salinarimonas soli]KAA2238204.1 malto-oligosyltrehalose synthase [Salinarimonas soli]
MSEHDALVERIAGLVGVGSAFADAFGRQVETSPETRRAILAGLRLPVDTEADARATLERLTRLKAALVPALIPVEAGRPAELTLRRPGGSATWRLTEEGGGVREGREILDRGERLRLPALAAGYHRLRVESGGETAHATIIAAPRQAFGLPGADADLRLWGATAQVYGLRSGSDFGIGGYGEVATAAGGAGALGAHFLGLSPVHALFSSDRTKFSPYSPSSRLFLETIFIDPRLVEGYEEAAAGLAADMGDRIAAVRDAPLVDHAAVWDVKRPLLDALWRRFQRSGDGAAFEAFRREGGAALQAHATFEALSEHFRGQGRWWIGDWPDEYRGCTTPEVRRFQAEQADLVAFHAWLQWQADLQLADAQEAARGAGMRIGLYRDLAVGADSAGSEVWAHPDRFAASLSVGAPPDPLGPQGQNWGLPPFDPLALEAQGLAAFRAMVAANMRHAGAIRIDHAFQLQRLFLIPSGMQASQGAYVDYPFEALLAVLRLESHRHRCLVIAEDLGTAPEGFSDAIMASGILSYRVQPFEREHGGAFKPPGAYPRSALAVLSTHDLPTFRGWWRALDVDLRQTLGVFDPETSERERANRGQERRQLAEALSREGLLAGAEPPEDPPLEAALRYLARTPCVLAGIQLEDAAGELNQANMPGLDAGHPNWRRRLGTDVETLTAPGGDLARLAAAMQAEGRGMRARTAALASPPPRATYRLQFHKDFTFDDAVRIVPYLARLGISHVYSSPIHTARPGSTHGYDIVDHSAVNPELGGEEGFLRLSDALREHGLGLILDIVPNHMGVGGADNGWWLSALEWGALSPFAKAFDIDWERLGAHGKLVLPNLGDRYGEALEKGELKLRFEPAEGSFSVWHWEHCFPVNPLAYPIILDRALAVLGGLEAGREVLAISERLRTMGDETNPERRAAFPAEADELKRRLAAAVAGSRELGEAIGRAVDLVNGVAGVPESVGTLHRILEMQPYRLAHWRVAASDINYRRFFDINALAGLRVEDPEVFERTHAMIFRLVAEGRIQGLRIDHIDGLADPEGYVRALQAAVGPGFYILAEKILEPGEPLRPWPLSGTTGYDVLNQIDGIFVDRGSERVFERIYRDATGMEGGYGALLRAAKSEILETSFASELEVLVSDLKRIADADRRTRDYTVFAMRRALVEIIARFPVYRSYITDDAIAPEDRALVEGAVEGAKRNSALPDRTVHDFAAAALLGDVETEGPGRPNPDWIRRFRRRFQQLTGPVMAKSLEDTLFYRFVRLVPLNEVGGDPGHFGLSLADFHKANAERARDWPYAMIATATHDTKRGEDARARLYALSEMPDAWRDAVERFERLCRPLVSAVGGEAAPDANDRYLLLQALLGAWPLDLLDGDGGDREGFRERLEGYLLKALREAKRHTSWVHGNEAYEGAATELLSALLRPDGGFLEAFRPLARRLAAIGMVNALARTALKLTLPGVPDTYQGTEMWDLSLVDPDNRRPVDFEARARALTDDTPAEALLAAWTDGRIKQRLTARLLADRAERPALYADGDYKPLAARGAQARRLAAFVREHGEDRLVVVVPRLVGALMPDERLPLGPDAWGDTAVALPPGRWRDVVTGREVQNGAVAELFGGLPIAVLRTAP